MMPSLDSMTIVITGGSTGIGYAIARSCVEAGATVIISARGRDALETALGQLRGIADRDHRLYAMDVGNLQAVQDFAGWLREHGIAPAGLVNCAGIFGAIGKTTSVDMREFTSAIQINLLGTAYMCHAVGPLMRSHGRRKIINCAGGGGTFPFPLYSAYAASKAAVVRLTENLAVELAEDEIDVNCIAPGFVATRLHEQTFAAGAEKAGAFFSHTQKQIASGGVPAERSAELATFLLSSDSDGISGKYISAPWDPWRDPGFQDRLRNDKDFGTLRRIDDQQFFRKAGG